IHVLMLRRLFITLAGLALLLMAAAGIGLWWLGTDSGLRFVVNRLQETMTAQGAELTIDEATGSLYRGVRIEQLSWRNADGMQVDGSDLVLRWSLPALLRRQVLIPELSAANLAIRLAP